MPTKRIRTTNLVFVISVAIKGFFSSFLAQAANPSPSLFWSFNNNTASDESGNSNNGAISNVTSLNAGACSVGPCFGLMELTVGLI